ncbi:MAG TPA: D-2-hydroxyacid dehydrogenase [Vicinamibacterales bacterium]
MRVLVAIYGSVAAWRIPDAQVAQLRREFPEHTIVRADSDAEVLERIPDADVVFGGWLKPEHIVAARRLRWIHSQAAGVGNMMFPEMIASSIDVTSSRGNSSATIAEHVIAVTLALLRDLPLAWRRQAERTWAQDEFDGGASIRTLRGARVLIIGLGSIGGEAGRLAAAFGAHVVGIRRRADGPPSPGVAAVVTADRLHDELPLADVVVLAAPQTPATTRLIGDRELAMMKDDAVLVNVSRGTLVDEAALARALGTGRLRGAALDVFEPEPLAPDSPLWARTDVLVTPHVSGFHAEYWPVIMKIFTDNLRRFAAGQPLANSVDKKAGY